MGRNTRVVYDPSFYPLDADPDPSSFVGLGGKVEEKGESAGGKRSKKEGGSVSTTTTGNDNEHHHSLTAADDDIDDIVVFDHSMETYVYSVHPQKQQNRRKLHCYIGLGVALFVLLVIVPVSVGVSNNNKEAAASSAASEPTVVVLSDPPGYLEPLCLEGYRSYALQNSTESSSLEACIEECAVADCCSFQEGEIAIDCYEGNEQACELYFQACNPLSFVGNSADGAVDMLDDKITGDDDDNKLYVTVTNTPLPNPPDYMRETVCSPLSVATEEGRKACQAVCQPAECCKFPERLPQSCLGGVGNNKKCMFYQLACAVLSDGGGASNQDQQQEFDIKEAPSTIVDICDPASLATPDGLQVCSDTCQDAQCCFDWEGSGEDYCIQDTDCTSYAPCLHLLAMSQTDDSIQEAVDQICTEETVQSPEGLAQCSSVCMQHTCCYDLSCPPEVDDTCPLYSGCKYLYTDGSFEEPVQSVAQPTLYLPPQDLAEICDEAQLLMMEGTEDQAPMVACALACDKAACCEVPQNLDGSCLRGNEDLCMAYHKECSVLYDNIGYFEPSDNVIAIVNTDTIDLELWCSLTGLDTPSYRDKCIDWCDSAHCCWSVEDLVQGQSCRDNPNCPGYAPCLNLRAGIHIDPEITDEVTTKCTSENLETSQGLEVCRQVCFQHRCCWDETVPLCYYDAEACDQYTACGEALSNKGAGDDW